MTLMDLWKIADSVLDCTVPTWLCGYGMDTSTPDDMLPKRSTSTGASDATPAVTPRRDSNRMTTLAKLLFLIGFSTASRPPARILRLSPLSAATPHNFGAVSDRDAILYTACRPGDPPSKSDPIADEAVEEWIAFMQKQGVRKVVALLDDNELANYDSDLSSLYAAGGLDVLVQPMRAAGASQAILNYVDQAAAADEKVVTHCTGGVGRSGRVAAAWLVHHHGLTPAMATEETLATAKVVGVNRKGDAAMLAEWLGLEE
jgi:protein-tyrosine phosphatase